MKSLSPNWFIEELVDLEYQQYILKAYLKEVSQSFKKAKLYPPFADLITHYKRLKSFRNRKRNLSYEFPQELTQINLKKLKAQYKKLYADDELMQEIEQIIDFALPLMSTHLQEGKELYDFVEDKMSIEPIGVLPLYRNEGYLFIKDGQQKSTDVYGYQITLFTDNESRYRSVSTRHIASYTNSLVNTLQQIKYDLIHTHKELPNPATYLVESKMAFPKRETILPIAKRLLVRFVAKE